MMKTTAAFVDQAVARHGNRFDYAGSRYVGFLKSVEIICHRHGPFTTTPKSHLASRSGSCPKCRKELIHNARSLATDEFVERAREVHGDQYRYHLAHCTGTLNPVVIVCPKHGPFRMRPTRHLCGRGCKKCAFERIGEERTLSFWDLVERIIEVHGVNRYEYKLQDFVNLHSKVPIECPKHGRFVQSLANHLKGTGCPSCVQSNGERRVREVLHTLDIEFAEQAKFEGCRNQQPLRFDFYVPSHRMLIEFDGQQHYDNSECWGGEERLAEIQHRDGIKNRFADQEGYRLLRIPYWEYDNIENILLDQLAT